MFPKPVFFAICLLAMMVARAQSEGPHLIVKFEKTSLEAGDTISFEATISNYPFKFGTLYLWVENAEHTRQWRFRYPLVQGSASAAIALPDTMPSGLYAAQLMVRRELIHMMGRVTNKKPPAAINLIGVANNKEMAASVIKVDGDGYFQVPNLVFDEKAVFVFSPLGKYPDNWLDIELETPIDSVFDPLASSLQWLTVGEAGQVPDTSAYKISSSTFLAAPSTFQDVEVIAKRKTQADLYAEKYITGFFEGDGYRFDGMEDNQIASAPSVLEFLTGKVPGLQIYYNRDSGNVMVHWRGYEPSYFVDGFETDLDGIQAINPNDVAIIKVMRPPFYGTSMGSAGGAIAVFLKKGSQRSGYFGNKYRFVVYGYTPVEAALQ